MLGRRARTRTFPTKLALTKVLWKGGGLRATENNLVMRWETTGAIEEHRFPVRSPNRPLSGGDR